MSFYKTKRWRKKAAVIKRRDGYQCQEAKRYGLYHEAEMVHHIYPRDKFPELAFENWNLISLSNKYHNKMHNRQNAEITELGRQWQKRRQNEFEKFYGYPPPCKNYFFEFRGTGKGAFSNSAAI